MNQNKMNEKIIEIEWDLDITFNRLFEVLNIKDDSPPIVLKITKTILLIAIYTIDNRLFELEQNEELNLQQVNENVDKSH